MRVQSLSSPAEPDADGGFAPYGRLVKMLLPSVGSIAIYDAAGGLLWCSDGFERPDLRALLDGLRAVGHDTLAGRGAVQHMEDGGQAFVAPLKANDGRPLGSFVLELGAADRSRSTGSMVASFVRPVLDCLEALMSLESTGVKPPRDDAGSVELLLSVDEHDREDSSALEVLLRQCVVELGCVIGALLLPDKGISLSCSRDPRFDGPKLLDRTQKHLLAWVQLNNRPMIVNRVGATAGPAPYKILSCPIGHPDSPGFGLLALFRTATAPDFELRDVRILEFVGRKTVGILASQHDPLTGLPNRLIFERRAQRLLDAAPAAQHALLYVDIDKLEAINDAFGLQAGDEVIQRCGEVLRKLLGKDDHVTRIGGDRFAILLPRQSAAAASELAERLRASMARLGYVHAGVAVPVTVSIGFAPARAGAKLSHVLAAAELACKHAKQRGRDRLELHPDEEAGSLAMRKHQLAAANLREALGTNGFRLEAQPIVGLRERPGEIVGTELLVRLRAPGGELIAPDKFLAAAERYRLMPALDRWVLASAVEQLRGAGPGNCSHGLLAVKVSAQSLASRGYAAFALEQIALSGLAPEAFCFELKEAAAVEELDAAEALIRELGAAGCRLALEDFGGALSSIAHLKRLPVRFLKIDGRFVRRIRDDKVAESLVIGITTAARTLGVAVIAAHVETAELAAKLGDLDVAYGQGFYLGRPVPFAPADADVVHAERRRAGT